uniref:Uncharacterized protein n=1 Tax=Ornithorhynchus anatinus TaxID=9258 RepID=A0A6I8PLF9_ORNAN
MGAGTGWERCSIQMQEGKTDGFLLGSLAEVLQDLQPHPLGVPILLWQLQCGRAGNLLLGGGRPEHQGPHHQAHGHGSGPRCPPHRVEGLERLWSGLTPRWLRKNTTVTFPMSLREARFAAGVAEQFAITEATLSAWSSLDDDSMLYGDRYGDHYGDHSQDAIQLQDLENNFLQDSLQRATRREDNSTLHSSLQAFSSSLTSPLPQAHALTGEWDLCARGPRWGLEHQRSQPEGLEKQEWQSESALPWPAWTVVTSSSTDPASSATWTAVPSRRMKCSITEARGTGGGAVG